MGPVETAKLKLAGRKCWLRPLEASDVTETYVAWLNDPEVNRFLGHGNGGPRQTLESLRRYLERFQGSRTDYIFAIIDTASGRHIGNVTLNRIDHQLGTGDTGILIGDKAFWGKGYAFDAWSALIPYAFDGLKLRKILAGAVAGHTASLAVLKKLGFKEEGLLRGEFLLDGAYRDYVRLGLFRQEFRGNG